MAYGKILIGVCVAAATGIGHAQTTGNDATQPTLPLDQAAESIEKNLAKNPDNKGLQNAAQRIRTNQARIEEAREASEERREARDANRFVRDMDARPSIERPVRPERPARVERPALPDRPGRG